MTKVKLVRPLYAIAQEIQADWGAKVNFGAKPYLQAMRQCTNLSDSYGVESAETQVRYFLSNATTWRGDIARRVKKELNAMIK